MARRGVVITILPGGRELLEAAMRLSRKGFPAEFLLRIMREHFMVVR